MSTLARATEHYVATKELRVLLHDYKTAYTTYMSSVHALSEATMKEVWPSAELLGKEEVALRELNFLRQALLDALYTLTHPKKGNAGSQNSK